MAISKDEAYQWLVKYHESSRKLDPEVWVNGFFAPDIVHTFANAPTIHGKDECLKFYAGQLARLESMEHRIESFDWIPDHEGGGGKILQKASIDYRVKGDPKEEVFSIPGFLVAKLARFDERVLMKEKEVYIDVGPLGQRMQEVAGKDGGN